MIRTRNKEIKRRQKRRKESLRARDLWKKSPAKKTEHQ